MSTVYDFTVKDRMPPVSVMLNVSQKRRLFIWKSHTPNTETITIPTLHSRPNRPEI